MTTNNPARRLITIYEKARFVTNDSKGVMTKLALWAKVFDIPVKGRKLTVDNLMEVFSRLKQLEKLINETEQILLGISGINHERYIGPFASMRSTVAFEGIDGYGSVTLADNAMLVLDFCEERIEERHVEPEGDEVQIKELLDEVNNLYEEVIASSLQDDLKKLILGQLEHIRRAIHEYRITGVSRLREEMPILVGNYVLNKDLLEKEGDKEEVKRFQGVLSKFAATVAFASHTTKLIEAAATYLPKFLPGG